MSIIQRSNYLVVVGNLIAMVVYTILLRLDDKNEGIIAVAFLLALHIVICIVVAIVLFIYTYKRQANYWLLSSLLLLLVGFSTCYAVYSIR